MTDNEQRAHDLAIAMLPFVYNEDTSQTDNETDNPYEPLYLEYLRAYNDVLDWIDRDFTCRHPTPF